MSSDTVVNAEIKKEPSSKLKIALISALAVALASFHLYTASFGMLPSYFQSSVHWALISTFIVLSKPLRTWLGKAVDALLIISTWYVTYYLITVQADLASRAGAYTKFEVFLGAIAIIAAIEIGRRVLGLILPAICVVFLLYAMFGSNVPGLLNTASFPIDRIAPYLYTGTSGLYGQTLYVSAQFIFLFVLFGTILDLTGAGAFFVDLAYSVAGRIAGGPAQAAVFSSMLLGTINGSGAANVVTTGTFTIPLMKKVGYRPAVAGAVEAVASSGGQIMPPVMGAAAFLMAEITGIPYARIVVSALIPAVLYYLTLSASVYVEARRNGLRGLGSNELPSFLATLRKGWLYLLPLVTLILLLAKGFSPQKSAFYAIVISLGIGLVKDRERMNLQGILQACKNAMNGIAPIAAACLLAGVIMGIIDLTGLGVKISGIIEVIAHGNLLLALFLTMITSLVLGMGLPTSAAYLILAVLAGPALVNLGVSTMATHLFLLYYGALSTITPPVALSTFAAAGIAGSGIWDTGIEAVKLAAAGFIVPFIFAYNDSLLLISGSPGAILIAIITAMAGCISLAVSLRGWFGKNLTPVTRILVFAGSILLIVPSVTLSLAGTAIVLVSLYFDLRILKRL